MEKGTNESNETVIKNLTEPNENLNLNQLLYDQTNFTPDQEIAYIIYVQWRRF